MIKELNLLESAPKSKRKFDPNWRTNTNRIIARRFDKDFFDGDRANGYGGYYYDGRWRKVVKRLEDVYDIGPQSSVLDIGCAKGFLLYDLQSMIPGIRVAGIDISDYALNHAMDGYGDLLMTNNAFSPRNADIAEQRAREKVLPHMVKASADELPYADNSFDVVLSINTTHNLPRNRFKKAIKEMIRVSKDKESMFIQLDSYANEKQKQEMKYWNLTGLTVMSDDEWIDFLGNLGYQGHFYGTKLS